MRKKNLLGFTGVLLLLWACGTGEENEPNKSDGIQQIALSVTCDHTVSKSKELCYVVFDESGAVITDENDGGALHKVSGANLANGEKFPLSFDVSGKAASVVILAYEPEDVATGGGVLNTAIQRVNEPLVSSPDGVLRGDYLVGRIDLNTSRSTNDLFLSRISGRIGIHLEGEQALVSSVERVEIEFGGTPFFNSILPQGIADQKGTSLTNPIISFSKDKYVYTLHTVSEKANSGTVRIYYDGGKLKECSLNAEAGFFVRSNHSTTLTLNLSRLQGTEIGVDLTSSNGWISQNQGEIDNDQESYLSYKTIKTITRTDFVPGAMAQVSNLLYVINTQGKLIDPSKPLSPTNSLYHSIEVFDIEKGMWLRTISGSWTSGSSPRWMLGTPRAIAADKDRVYVAYGNISLPYATCVAVFDAVTENWITSIGGRAPYQVSNSIFDVDEGVALCLNKEYLYMSDNRCPFRVYCLSDITAGNSEKIAPYMMSPTASLTGPPHPMSIFRHPDGTLMRTDYSSKMIYAIDETKITAGTNVDVTNPSRNVDLTAGMYSDIRLITAFEGTTPYNVASYGNTLFVAANPNTKDNDIDGYICTFNSRWEYIGALGSVPGYTFSKPTQVVVAGDRLIVADQNKKTIVIIQITSHIMDKYE